jgi:hypothetical protein
MAAATMAKTKTTAMMIGLGPANRERTAMAALVMMPAD